MIRPQGLVNLARLKVPGGSISHAVQGATSALVDFLAEVRTEKLTTVLERREIVGLATACALPDAVWQALVDADASLDWNPLGRAVEHAVKRVVAEVTSPAAGVGRPPDSRAARERLESWADTAPAEDIGTGMATHLLAELAFDQLRRPRPAEGRDLAYRYEFDGSGCAVSPDVHRGYRRRVLKECRRLAPRFLKRRSAQQTSPVPLNVVASPRSVSDLTRVVKRHRWANEIDDRPLRLVLHAPPPRRRRAGSKRSPRPKKPNVSVSVDRLKTELACLRAGHLPSSCEKEHPTPELASLSADLIDLGTVTFMADLYTPRGRELERRLGILMPVQEQAAWDRAGRSVNRALGFLGRDEVQLRFIARRAQLLPLPAPRGDAKACVCLLSGGLDSLAGAVWALEEGLDPVLVGHYANTRLAGVQARLVEALGSAYGRKLPLLQVSAAKSRARSAVQYPLKTPKKSVMAQYLRSFLFLSLGGAVALELGIDRVLVPENGPIALNPMVSEGLVDTRTAHPRFLALFERMVNEVTGRSLRFENPLLYRTKGEVALLLAESKVRSQVRESESCWQSFRVPLLAKQLGLTEQKGCRHDGECLPCVIRRASVHRAGMWAEDTTYLIDLFEEFADRPREIRTVVADCLRFCQLVVQSSDTELLSLAADFSVHVSGVDCSELVAMYRRHAHEVLTCFRERSKPEVRAALEGILA